MAKVFMNIHVTVGPNDDVEYTIKANIPDPHERLVIGIIKLGRTFL